MFALPPGLLVMHDPTNHFTRLLPEDFWVAFTHPDGAVLLNETVCFGPARVRYESSDLRLHRGLCEFSMIKRPLYTRWLGHIWDIGGNGVPEITKGEIGPSYLLTRNIEEVVTLLC